MLVAVCLGLSVPVMATFHEGGVPLSLKIGSAILLALTAVRPAWGLMMLAGLLPLATVLRALALAPATMGGNEAAEWLAVPVIVAAGLRLAAGRMLPPSRLSRPGILFATLGAASALLQMLSAQLASGPLAPYLADVSHHLLNGYFEFAQAQVPLHMILGSVEAIALAVVTERLLRQDAGLGRPLLRTWLLGAAGAAAFSAIRLVQISLSKPDSADAFVFYLVHQRLGPLYADINAVGSYFALCAVPAIWFALRSRRAWPWATAGLIVLALWLAGSRTALAAAVIGLAFTWLIDRRPPWRRAVAVSIVAMTLAYATTWNPGRVQASPEYAAGVRAEMARVGLRIAAEHPIFGAGIGLFRRSSLAFLPADFMARFPPAAVGENAHNNFIQVLAELGVTGLGAFVAVLLVPLGGTLRAVRDGTASWELAALAGGLLAFLITCLGGHPLLTQQAYYQFFFALGITAGVLPVPPASVPRRRVSWRDGRFWFGLALAGVLFAVPFRALDVARTANRSGLVYGASQPLTGVDGQLFRLADERSSWFVPANATVVVLPLRLALQSEPPCRVEISLDGRRANAVEPGRDAWLPVDLVLPPPTAGLRSRRVDLRVSGGHCWLMVGPVTHR